MAPQNPTIPQSLLEVLRSSQTSFDTAVDALEEWILSRRTKGATLFEVAVGLAELEDRTPPSICRAFDVARYITNVPSAMDLTPPTGPFPLSRSQSPQTVLHHLLSTPTPTIEHSREVILEFVLAKETKLREKRPGRGGKGTMGREGFEEISKRLTEVEDGLRRSARASMSPLPSPAFTMSDQELDEPRTIGLALILSLRMTLSYFTLRALADQLLLLAMADAERALVQHIRRRVQGEGRYGVGMELEQLEGLTSKRRALRPVFRSAKARTQLPSYPRYPIALPSPAKSQCIRLLQTFARDLELHGTPSASFTSRTISPTTEKGAFKRSLNSPGMSPRGRPPWSPTKLNTSTPDPNALANYALELVSEFITREKREYMMKMKWAKSGRDQLSKDLGDIESSMCMVRSSPGPHASTLLPIFLLLRRTFSLPSSPLPSKVVESYLDLLPPPPDPDSEPFREPDVQTTTLALYVNPRLDDDAALAVLSELVDSEMEKATAAGISDNDRVDWVLEQIEMVKKRFPDGSYDEVFSKMLKYPILNGPTDPRPIPHRRTQSHVPTLLNESPESSAPKAPMQKYHARSASMPHRQMSYDEDSVEFSSDSSSSISSDSHIHRLKTTNISPPRLTTGDLSVSPFNLHAPGDDPFRVSGLNVESPPTLSAPTPNGRPLSDIRSDISGPVRKSTSGGSGWWDVVSAVEATSQAPWQDKRASSILTNDLPLPPGAEPAKPRGHMQENGNDMHEEEERLDSRYMPGEREAIFLGSPARRLPQPSQASPQGSPMRPPRRDVYPEDGHSWSPGPPSPVPQTNGSSSSLSYDGTPNFSRPMMGQSSSSSSDEPEREQPQPPTASSKPRLPPLIGASSSPAHPYPHSQPIPSPQKSRLVSTPSVPTTRTPTTPNTARPRLFSLGTKSHKKDKDKDKEKGGDRGKENERILSAFGTMVRRGDKDKDKDKEKVTNNPGKWNKDMVANIMGPPAERR